MTTLVRPAVLRVLVVVAGLAAVVALIVAVADRSFVVGAGLIVVAAGAAVAAVIAFLVPVHVLPAIALTAFAIAPIRLVPATFTFRMTLWGVLLVVWALRRVLVREKLDTPIADRFRVQRMPSSRAFATLFGLALLAWAALVTVRSSYSDTGYSWLLSFTICGVLPLLVVDAEREAQLLRRCWIWLTGLLAIYAVIELFLQGSPVIGRLYEVLGIASSQHWSVYRAEITLGHPLLAGTFFTVGAALAFASWLQSGRRSDLVLGALSAAGVVATVSRGPMLAVVVAIALTVVVVAVRWPDRSIARPVGIAIVGIVAIVGVLNFEPVAARNDNVDAAVSTGARVEGLGVAFEAARLSNMLGSGAGTSGIMGRFFSDVVIENSLLQLLISLGIPGLVLFLAYCASLVITALRVSDIAPVAAMVGFVICLTGFNAIDAVRPSHLLLGFLVIICANPEPPDRWTPSAISAKHETVTLGRDGVTQFRVPAGRWR